MPSLTVRSTPVWRMAEPQVSPSIPTQTEAEPEELPGAAWGVGTVKVPVTDVKVPYKIERLCIRHNF